MNTEHPIMNDEVNLLHHSVFLIQYSIFKKLEYFPEYLRNAYAEASAKGVRKEMQIRAD